MAFCLHCHRIVEAPTDEAKRRHVVQEHPDVAVRERAFKPSDVPDPRVAAKIYVDGDCWMWTGATNPNGYGHFVRRRGLGGAQKKTYVHRYVYSALVGPIPTGHEVHHSCYNRWCCRPEHLSPVTHQENNADSPGAGAGTRVT